MITTMIFLSSDRFMDVFKKFSKTTSLIWKEIMTDSHECRQQENLYIVV